MTLEADRITVFECHETQHIDRVRLVPVLAQQRPMVAVCLQGGGNPFLAFGTQPTSYWSEVFLYDAVAGRPHQTLAALTSPYEFVAAPGPRTVAGLSYVLPGELVGLPSRTQAVVSANLAWPWPAYSHPLPVPAVKNVRFEAAVDLHGLGRRGVALASPERPPMIWDDGEGWRMLEGTLRPRRLYAALPNVLIGLGETASGASAAAAWQINSPFVVHAFGRPKGVTQVAVSTSGNLVALGGPDGISVHRVTGEEVVERVPVPDRLDGVLLDDTRPEPRVVRVSESGITLWNAVRNVCVADFPAANEPVIECQFVPTHSGVKVMLATRRRVFIRDLG
ncbi:hypothetical protein GCM10009839_77750 [Catenulispora yoronensis]|uniref:WD40 repeat domain-containing protein n=1 Tax=Catenulispora yoronensis TaxID=450799 RepID=A0ABN2VA99_9ACTN